MKKSLFSIVLVASMVASLTACSGANSAVTGGGGTAVKTVKADTVRNEEQQAIVDEQKAAAQEQANTMDWGEYTKENPLEVNIGGAMALTSVSGQGLSTLISRLEEDSEGRIKVNEYANKAMGDDKETIENLIAGNLDITWSEQIVASNWNDILNLLSMGYLFESEQQLHNFLSSDVAHVFDDSLKEYGLSIHGLTAIGLRNVNATKKVEKLEDIKGMMIRVMESQIFLDCFEAYGANPVAMSKSELIAALQQGTVDAEENTPAMCAACGAYEFEKYLNHTAHAAQFYLTLVNDSFLAELPPDVAKFITDICEEVAFEHSKLLPTLQAEYKQQLLDAGLEWVETDTSEFIEAVQPVWEKYRAKWGDEGAKIIDAIKALPKD